MLKVNKRSQAGGGRRSRPPERRGRFEGGRGKKIPNEVTVGKKGCNTSHKGVEKKSKRGRGSDRICADPKSKNKTDDPARTMRSECGEEKIRSVSII